MHNIPIVGKVFSFGSTPLPDPRKFKTAKLKIIIIIGWRMNSPSELLLPYMYTFSNKLLLTVFQISCRFAYMHGLRRGIHVMVKPAWLSASKKS